jgi:large subunit ribosomal protein L25
MKKAQLEGTRREAQGTKAAKDIRNAGGVPAVLYGGTEQVHLSVDRKALGKLIYTPEVFQVELNIEGTTRKAIMKEVQFHPVTDEIIHIDFLELFADKPVKVKLPVRVIGSSLGVKNGGKLRVQFRKIDVVGLPDALPEDVEVDITPLRIGNAIRVKELATEKGVKFLNDPNAVVVMVAAARGAKEDSDEEGEEAATEESAAE